MVDKRKLHEWLLKFFVLLPGNHRTSAKRWFQSPWTLFSLLAMGLTLFYGVVEFLHINGRPRHDRGAPPSPPPFNLQFCPMHSQPHLGDPMHEGPPDEPKGVMVNLVVGSARICGYFINIIVRILVMLCFSQIRQVIRIFETSASSTNKIRRLFAQNWLECSQRWSRCEKVYLWMGLISLIAREADTVRMISDIYTCPPYLLVGDILTEQSKVLWSLDCILDLATFALISYISAFVNVFRDFGGSKDILKPVWKFKIPSKTCGKVGQIVLDQKVQQAWQDQNLPQITELNTAADIAYADTDQLDLKLFIRPIKPKMVGTCPNPKQSIGNYSDELLKEMEHGVGIYFEAVGLWKEAETVTGFTTLIVFIYATFGFCLQAFMGLAAVSEMGVGDSRFLCSLCSAVLIVCKITLVANLAQDLPDSTKELADRVINLRWKASGILAERGWSKEKLTCWESDYWQVTSYITNHPLTLSALGYFKVTKSSLTTVTGIVITYLVVLVQFHMQFQSTSTSLKASFNHTIGNVTNITKT